MTEGSVKVTLAWRIEVTENYDHTFELEPDVARRFAAERTAGKSLRGALVLALGDGDEGWGRVELDTMLAGAETESNCSDVWDRSITATRVEGEHG